MRLLVRLLLLVAALAVVVVGVTAVRVWQAGNTDTARKADALVVLGAAQYDGRPQDFLQARLEHAQELYEAGQAPRILTVGGKQPGDRFTEAEAAQHYLVEHQVPESDVLTVGVGRDTLGSMKAVAAAMKERGWRSAIVVTDPWHVLRATSMLADQGVTVYGSPTTTGPSVQGDGVKARYVVRETFGYLAYELGL